MPKSYTIGQLGRRCGLSRSALLYYDSIGLLVAPERSPSNYRRYSSEDLKRLERIRLYRQAGLALKDIQRLLSSKSAASAPERSVLECRLGELGAEMNRLRVQRELLLRMLKRATGEGAAPIRRVFVAVLRQLGLSESELDRLHDEFERLAPDDHHRFLRFIGLSEAEARSLRAARQRRRSHA